MRLPAVFPAALLASALLASPVLAATPVFSDNFDDNDVSDWTFSTNYGGVAGIDTGGVLGPYIDAPPGGGDLIARATRSLNLLAGDYILDFDVFTVNCQGCVISYDVLLNGASLTRTATFGATVHRALNLGTLAAGAYDLTLGMHTTSASSGHFLATFDNVVLTGDNLVTGGAVPEPSAWALMILGFGAAGAILRRRGGGLSLAPV